MAIVIRDILHKFYFGPCPRNLARYETGLQPWDGMTEIEAGTFAALRYSESRRVCLQ